MVASEERQPFATVPPTRPRERLNPSAYAPEDVVTSSTAALRMLFRAYGTPFERPGTNPERRKASVNQRVWGWQACNAKQAAVIRRAGKGAMPVRSLGCSNGANARHAAQRNNRPEKVHGYALQGRSKRGNAVA